MSVNPIPDNYPRICVGLSVDGAADAIAFYEKVLGAVARGDRMVDPQGRIGHSELEVGDSLLMVTDEYPEIDYVGPKKIGGTPVNLMIYVEDVDKTFAAAIEAGATEVREVRDQFYGDRSGTFEDPWGHRWTVGSHIEDVDPAQMEERMSEAMSEGAGE